MANFFEEYMITPNLLNKFSNVLKPSTNNYFSSGNDAIYNYGTIGNAANDYINGTPSQGAISDTITGKNNGNSAITNAIDDYVKTPNTSNFDKTKLANALAAMPKTTTGLTSQPQFTVTPSRVDYSQFIGLSPITQRYLYGGM